MNKKTEDKEKKTTTAKTVEKNVAKVSKESQFKRKKK